MRVVLAVEMRGAAALHRSLILHLQVSDEPGCKDRLLRHQERVRRPWDVRPVRPNSPRAPYAVHVGVDVLCSVKVDHTRDV
jgi:hypothetical protein